MITLPPVPDRTQLIDKLPAYLAAVAGGGKPRDPATTAYHDWVVAAWKAVGDQIIMGAQHGKQ
jgi:hypothetical protein